MKKFLSLALAAIGITAFTSCSNDEYMDMPTDTAVSSKYITFNSPFVGKNVTRATVTQSNLTEQRLKIYADRQEAGSQSWNVAIADNELYNNAGTWILKTPAQWYYANNYRFSGAAPSDAPYSYTDGKVKLEGVTAVMEESAGTDYIVSNQALIQNVDDEVIENGVSLTMRHIMSKYQFVVKNTGTKTIHINSAKVYLPKSDFKATYTQTSSEGEGLDGEWEWDSYSNPATFDDNVMVAYQYKSSYDLAGSNQIQSDQYFVAPYSGLKLFFDLDYELHDSDGNVIKRVTIEKKKFAINLSAGVSTSAIVEIDMDGNVRDITFSSVTLVDFDEKVTTGDGNVELVDLGLSVRWATTNLGAVTPEEFGDFFWWGDPEGRTSETEFDYSGTNPLIRTYGLSYDELESKGYAMQDPKKSGYILTPQYDAATRRLGSLYRMPTNSEAYELAINCDWEVVMVNGVQCKKGTSKKNGNTIIIPFNGAKIDTRHVNLPFRAKLWTRSVVHDGSNTTRSWAFEPSTTDHTTHQNDRHSGGGIRAVSEY